jgi:hypothetical protein
LIPAAAIDTLGNGRCSVARLAYARRSSGSQTNGTLMASVKTPPPGEATVGFLDDSKNNKLVDALGAKRFHGF